MINLVYFEKILFNTYKFGKINSRAFIKCLIKVRAYIDFLFIKMKTPL